MVTFVDSDDEDEERMRLLRRDELMRVTPKPRLQTTSAPAHARRARARRTSRSPRSTAARSSTMRGSSAAKGSTAASGGDDDGGDGDPDPSGAGSTAGPRAPGAHATHSETLTEAQERGLDLLLDALTTLYAKKLLAEAKS